MKSGRGSTKAKITEDIHRSNIAGTVTWLTSERTPVTETPASWLSENGGTVLIPFKSSALSALGTATACYALVDRFRRDPHDKIGSIVAVLTVNGPELRQLLKVGSTYFTVTPGGNDYAELRDFGEFSIWGIVERIVINLPAAGVRRDG